jgi:NAD(P)-dependent dehydrogenase (short-subunit alcohol dehydrogenase family)
MESLKGKRIVVTGGGAGIGLACAQAYAREGARVAILSLEDNVTAIAAELGAGHLGLLCDVSDSQSVETAFSTILQAFSGLDAIHNNAGIAHPSKPLHETSDEAFDQLMNVNLKSILYTTRFGLPSLRVSKGAILNTGSMVGEIGQDNHAVYTATKGALHALTKSMALDYAPYGIRVNALAPAAVWTETLKRWNQEQPDPARMADYLARIHPLGYCPEPDVIADAAVFLLSDQSRFITGCILPVSGGAELGYRSI